MEYMNLEEGQYIRFKSPIGGDAILEGKVRGIATAGQPIIGRNIIVEITNDSFPKYGFSCIVITECSIVDHSVISQYDFTENDNHIHLVLEDGQLDELWVGDGLNEQHTVIGFEDLRAALESIGYTIVTKEFIEKLDKSVSDSAEWECDRTGYYPKVVKPSEDPFIRTKSK